MIANQTRTQSTLSSTLGRPDPALRSRDRRGGILLEAAMALSIVATGLVFAATTSSLANRMQRDTERRAAAEREVANVAERLLGVPYQRLPEFQGEQPVSPDGSRLDPAARLTVQLEEVPEPTPARRIRIAIVGPSGADPEAEWASLTVWRFAMPGEVEP